MRVPDNVAGPRVELGTLAYETNEIPFLRIPHYIAVEGGFEPPGRDSI